MRQKKGVRKSAERRRRKGNVGTQKNTEGDNAKRRRELLREYGELETEEREMIDKRGLTNCLELLVASFESSDIVAQKLNDIDDYHDKEIIRQEAAYKEETGEWISFGPPVDLHSSILAVSTVQQYLEERGTVSIALERLKLALSAALAGMPPAMLIGPTLNHRAPDSSKISEIKGMLAAAMHEYQRREKLSRAMAASAVLKNIWPDLRAHLSRTEITIRMIQNWHELYGAKNAKPGPGKNSYEAFKKVFASNPESHDKYIQYLTADYARSLPSP
jgi:hypothetical protein